MVNSLVDRVLVRCRSVIVEMTRTGRNVAIEHVPRGDNQTADGLAIGFTPRSLCSRLSLPLLLAFLATLSFIQTPRFPPFWRAPHPASATPQCPSEALFGCRNSSRFPWITHLWSFLRGFGASEDTLVGFWANSNVRTVDAANIPLDRFNQCLQVASARAESVSLQDPGAFNEGVLLHKALPRLLLAKTKPAGFPFVTWNSLISHRAERFLAGDWQGPLGRSC